MMTDSLKELSSYFAACSRDYAKHVQDHVTILPEDVVIKVLDPKCQFCQTHMMGGR